jgi:drug/metabolite transporter (DMT)-like permease
MNQHINPRTSASRILFSVPVVGMATGIVFLGEIPTWSDWIALCLIISALALVLIWPAVGRKAR